MNTDRTKRILPGGWTRLFNVMVMVALVLGLVAMPGAQAASTEVLSPNTAPLAAPVAVNDTYSIAMGATLSVAAPGVLANDTHDVGTTLTAIKVSDPTRGGIVVNLASNGALDYVPPTASFTGVDRFTYKANDGTADSNVATVTIAVGNHAPVAVNDAYTTTQGTPLTISAPGVLSNDTDADSDPLTAVKVSDPAHGTVTVNVNGSLTYTPTAGYSGADSFTYTANDGAANSNTATVNVTVQGPEVNLLGYWKFDEGAGTTAADSSANHNNGTLSGGAVFTTTAAPITDFADPGSISLSAATSSLVSVPNSAINRLTNNFTVMGWVNPSSLSGVQRVVATAKTVQYDGGWAFGLNGGKIRFTTYSKKDYDSPDTGASAGQWVHIAAVMDSSYTVSFYADGVFIGSVAGTSAGLADMNDALLIGGATLTSSPTLTELFNGQLDDVRVYNRALSASEVASLVGVSPCSEPVFRARVAAGEASTSKTITLDGACTYPLTYAADAGNGGSGIKISNATTLEGNGATIERSAGAPQFRIMTISPASTVRNLTLRGGNGASFGGGLLAFSDLTLSNVRFENNNVVGIGGGLYALGNLTLTNVYFGNNTTNHPDGATYVNIGGAVYAAANLTVDRSTFVGNQTDGYGGAINFAGLSGRITNSVFVNNTSGSSGAGVRSSNAAGTLTLLNNTFSDQYNNPEEAVLVNGNATLTNNIFDNFAAGLMASGGVTYTVTEDYNLWTGNTASPRATNGSVVTSVGHSRIAASSRFVNPATFNYHLQQNSPAIDMGTNAGVATDADGNPRPFTGGTPVDIGAYEYQGVGVPSLSITKYGPPYAAASGQTEFVLTVINESNNSMNDLRITDQLPTGATYVASSASGGGTLNGSTLTWNLSPLSPGQIARVWYQVTATQDLVSNNYSVSSISTPAITASGPTITTTYDANYTALGFSPFPNGYSFANWGTPTLDTDVTPADMPHIYGTGVCKVTSPSCVLTAAAEANRQVLAGSGSGGHCGGTAMSSLWMYDTHVNPATYQPGAINTFDLTQANIRNLIVNFHSTQGFDDADTTGLTPYTAASGAYTVVNTLLANFANPSATNRYTLWFFKPEGGGHAVVPIAVKKIDNDHYRIYIYDVNWPNIDNRYFEITMSTGAWSYNFGAANPSVPPSTWAGDGSDSSKFMLKSLRYAERFPKKCTAACAPDPFSKIGPADGATNQPANVTLSWAASDRAIQYQYTYTTTNPLSDTNALSTWYVGGTALTKTLSGLKPGTTYYWQVRSYNGGGYTYSNGYLTATWSFTTMSPTMMSEVTAMAAPQAVAAPQIASLPTYDFQLEGEGSLMVTRSDGKRAGVDPATGQFITEIPGAEQIQNPGGLLNFPAIIRIPHEAGMTYSLRIADTKNAFGNQSATADVNIMTGGYVTRLTGLKIDSPANFGAQPSGNGLYSPMASAQSGSNDVVGVTFDGDNHQVGFTSSALDSDTPALSMAVSQNGAPDFSFEVGGAQMSSGHTLSVGVNPDTGKLSITNNDPVRHTYNLDVERINQDGSKTTYHGTTSDGSGAGTLVDLGPSWTGGAPSITQQHRIYLPIVLR